MCGTGLLCSWAALGHTEEQFKNSAAILILTSYGLNPDWHALASPGPPWCQSRQRASQLIWVSEFFFGICFSSVSHSFLSPLIPVPFW